MEKNFTTLGPYVLPVSEQVRNEGEERRGKIEGGTVGVYL